MNRYLKTFFYILTVAGLLWRIDVALHHQSRAWIDEIWVVLNPAYQLLTGVGHLNPHDWDGRIRSWIPPTVLCLYLKLLTSLGVTSGAIVLAAVRLAISVATWGSFIFFITVLVRCCNLKHAPLIPALALLYSPEFVHYGTLADLSVLGIPPLLTGLALLFWDKPLRCTLKVVFGCACLVLGGGIIRFQFGLVSAAVAIYFLWMRYTRMFFCLLLVGISFLFLDFAFNSWIFGQPTLPLYRYAHADFFEGAANDAGTRPFYYAFEMLWHFTMEPTFLLIVLMLPIAFRDAACFAWPSYLLMLVFTVLGHKEYRYFYGPAVMLSGLSAAIFQKWIEANWNKKFTKIIACIFVLTFIGFSMWRGIAKVRWRDYEIPSKLETLAGDQPDIKGLIVCGWAGVYTGGHYTFHQPLPYQFFENYRQVRFSLKEGKLNFHKYNYLIVPESHTKPCVHKVYSEGGAGLYRCTQSEFYQWAETGE